MQGAAALDQIKAWSGCFELALVTEYQGSRLKRDGSHQQVTIRVFDRGGEEEHPRFHIEAEADDGTRTTGTAAHSLEGALERVHWEELDR
jgi:hypothetical protein